MNRKPAQGLVEYSLIAVLVAVLSIGALTTVGGAISSAYTAATGAIAGEPGGGGGGGDPEGFAYISLLSAIHDSDEALDVIVDGVRLDAASGEPFLAGGGLSGYGQVPAGTRTVKICYYPDDTLCPLGPVDLYLSPDTHYTLAAVGPVASATMHVFADEAYGSAPDRVRFVHLASDLGQIDLMTAGGALVDPVLTNYSFGGASPYRNLGSGNTDIEFCASADHSTCYLTLPAYSLTAGTNHTLYLYGENGTYYVSFSNGDGVSR